MSKRVLLYSAGILVLILSLWWFFRSTGNESKDVLLQPQRGDFQVSVSVSGELQAKNSIDIHGPEGARAEGIWQLKIEKLIPEGSIVKQGDWVADLDKTEIASKVRDAELGIQKAEAQYTQTLLDSSLSLSSARDDITNQRSQLEETKLQLDQSAYEPPAIKRRTELEYQSAERRLKQSIESYQTKLKQSVARMSQASAELQKERQKMESMTRLFSQLSVVAPANGMVIYNREWSGKKKTVGSQISAWDPTVATLPDLSQMISVCYVNEVDIQKVKKEQSVNVGFDSDPSKKLHGKVIEVANIGEQRPNSDSKVFEVRIQVIETDTLLRPAMTTANHIIVAEIKNVLHIPLECLHVDSSRTFVYLKSGSSLIKREIKTGAINENEAVISQGLSESDRVYLSTPPNAEKAQTEFLKP